MLPTLSLLALACGKDADTGRAAPADDTAPAPCDGSLAHVTWAVTVTPLETDCGVEVGEPYATFYGVEYTGLGFALRGCDGLDADGVIAGCEWTYIVEELSSRPALLPEGGTWSLEAAGYAWDEPVDICSLPHGLDWQTTEVMTLEEPGATGLPEDCTWTAQVEGSVY